MLSTETPTPAVLPTDTPKTLAIKRLQYALSPGDMVYTILRHASASGMQRSISLAVVRNGAVDTIDYLACPALGRRVDQKNGGIIVRGCGMDMGYSLVCDLGRVLWPGGFACVGESCPSNDHSNGVDRSVHPDGGYALRHRWL